MPKVTITIEDAPEGGINISSDHQPAIGAACSPAQQAALEIVNRTRKQWGVRTAPKPIPVAGLDIDAIHRRRDNVIHAAA